MVCWAGEYDMPYLTRNRWCSYCLTAHEGRCRQERGTPAERGYDAAWRVVRSVKLMQDPCCEDCLPRITPAVDVHHIRRISEAPWLRLELSNLMALCKACHAVRTARGE